MPVTSGQYNFQSVETELLIREAFERIGILGEYVEPQKMESAKRSINILLLDWMTKTTNLWTIKEQYLGLVAGKRQYPLNSTVNDILQVNVRTSSRQLAGTPQTNTGATYDNNGGGVAANAFDGDYATSCQQNVDNGNISYDYGLNKVSYITFVGFVCAENSNYELLIESCPTDPTVLNSWKELVHIDSGNYEANVPYFFDIGTPVSSRAYRIRGVNNDTPLNFSEIYFNTNTVDLNLSEVSRFEYNSYPNKYVTGRPSIYYLNRQQVPILNIYPTASTYYNCLYISYKKMMQDVGLYFDTIDIPAKLYPALVWGLSWQLALKYKPDMAQMLEAKYEQSFSIAAQEDSESVTVSIERGYT